MTNMFQLDDPAAYILPPVFACTLDQQIDLKDPTTRKFVLTYPRLFAPGLVAHVSNLNTAIDESTAAALSPSPNIAITEATVTLPSRKTAFAYYDGFLGEHEEVEQHWLWQDRIPLGGITLLDGDINCGKSVFAHMLAACVSSGKPLPDGSPTIQGGVVIVAPYEDASKGLYARLAANGANMSNVRVISFLPDTSSEAVASGSTHRHFQLPDDLKVLRAAMQEADARLVILDPFMETLPVEKRVTQSKLRSLLRKLHQLMTEMDATCLLTRQCPARGGSAEPGTLERSMHFLNVATSHLLLARDPMQPGHFFLTQAACRMQDLAPTIGFTITRDTEQPRQPLITITGLDPLQSCDLLTLRPGTLHLKLLAPRLHAIVAASPEPITLANLQTRFPHSTTSQVQRALRQQVQSGKLARVRRGLYAVNVRMKQEETRLC